jgi:CelD/BcsL family acetyltransferase involved in cellulose biosynthesis
MRRRAKHLQEKGPITFERAEGIEQKRQALGWIMDQKLKWLSANKIRNPWMTGSFRPFIEHVVANGGSVEFLTLKVAGQPIAGSINLVDLRRVEFYVTTFDPEWSRYSPGILLLERCMEWACDRRLEFDMGILEFDYKRRFSNQRTVKWSFAIATTWRGLPELFRHRKGQLVLRIRTILGRYKRKIFARAKKEDEA